MNSFSSSISNKQVESIRDWNEDAINFKKFDPPSVSIVEDMHKKPCLLVFPEFLRGEDLIESANAIRALIQDFNSIPKIKDTSPRHVPPDNSSLKWGAYNFGAWYENGGKTGHMLSPSKDTQGALHSRATEDFYIRTSKLSSRVSALLQAFKPDIHARYRAAVQKASQFRNLSHLLSTEKEAYLCRCVLINAKSKCHRDLKDVRDGWTAVISFGSYNLSYLCFPDLKLRVCIRPGTLVFLPSYILSHYMMEVEGDERYTMIFFMHEEHMK
ncbi:hypothetical protein AKO1_000500 [Acrasis kona]|uniref:Uncharacterized protein n=1 Tax=Acrasis kona TaxID=1008807 RepID=A0AAW2Z2Z7_9EUKA